MVPPRVVPRPKPRAQRQQQQPGDNKPVLGTSDNVPTTDDNNNGSQQLVSEPNLSTNSSSAPVRLESLSGRSGTPGGGGSSAPSSRASSAGPRPVFRPKMIARRNKEERENAAKQAEEEASIAAAIAQPKQPPGQTSRGGGRGGRGGGFGSRRGGGKQEPRITFASGPFAMPSFGSSHRVGRAKEKQSIGDLSSMGGRPSSSKKKQDGEESSDSELTMSSGTRRIDVSGKPARNEHFGDSDDEDDEETQFFPVRVTRVPHRDPTATGVNTLPSSVSTLPVDGEGATIKSEQDEEITTTKIKSEPQEDDNNLPQQLSTGNSRPLVPEYCEEEQKRLEQDYRTLTREFSLKSHLGGGDPVNKGKGEATKGKLMIFQTSSIFPQFKNPGQPIKKEKIKKEVVDSPSQPNSGPADREGVINVEEEDDNDEATAAAADNSQGLSGQIGTLRIHRSGKLTMMIGGVEMNVRQGIPCSFLQDVVYMDSRNQKRASQLGQSTQKLLLTPNIYQR